MTQDTCPIWGTPLTIEVIDGRDGLEVESARVGGKYFVSGSAVSMLGTLDEQQKVLLTSWLVEQRRLGTTCPDISSSTLIDVKTRRPTTVHDRADNLLRYLASRSELLGFVVAFRTPIDIGTAAHELMAWTASRLLSEVVTLAEYANAEGWIEYRTIDPTKLSDRAKHHQLMLRPPGYARIAEIDGRGSSPHQAFVAMWFDPSMADAYDNGIAMAIRDAGYEPVRIDQKDHNNKIDDEIIAEIRRSRFVVADFTQGNSGARGGVYYEAGFAHGLNIPVIFTCRADVLEDVHFDTRQYNHITWQDADDLRDRLAKRISATIGDGPVKST